MGIVQVVIQRVYLKIVSSIEGPRRYRSDSNFHLAVLYRELQDIHYKHQFDDFHGVKSISAGECHIAGIWHDGSVACWDGQGGWESVPDFKNKVKEWRNIKQVAVGYENIIALTYEGKILGTAVGFYEDYHDLIQVDAYGHYYGDCYSMALRRNGTVMSLNYEEVSIWRNIVQIACGWDVALGLRKDGKVGITTCDTEITIMVSFWVNIINIECKFSQIIAISAEGRLYNVYIH